MLVLLWTFRRPAFRLSDGSNVLSDAVYPCGYGSRSLFAIAFRRRMFSNRLYYLAQTTDKGWEGHFSEGD